MRADPVSHPHGGDPLLSLEDGTPAVLRVAVVHAAVRTLVREERGHAHLGLHKHIRLGESRGSSLLRHLTLTRSIGQVRSRMELT